VIKLNSWRKEA